MKINIESSTVCQGHCSFCPTRGMTRKMGMMSDELFHKVIKEGKEMGIKVYSPFMTGEPFLFPKIYQWMDYMTKEDVMINLYTNGEFMDVDRLVKYPNVCSVTVSLNGATKETHEKIMGISNFDKIKAKIEDLIKKAHFGVMVSMVITEDNLHEVELFKKMWGEHAFCGRFINYAGAKHSSLEKSGIKKPCSHLRVMNILWDGRVPLCCLDYDGQVILGDVNKQSLREIWNNARPIRNRHHALDFDMPLCRDCNFNIR
ncbi:MAG: radical SAM/SPASM domain-containing protein [Candidatus Zambryskibacteria bacterium]|nr:radical SAM/SPASM domain-containing protein [Candidatus Zambryskibacteria bacterium]